MTKHDDLHDAHDPLGVALRRASAPIDGVPYDDAEVRQRLARRASRRTAVRMVGVVGVMAVGAVGVWQTTSSGPEVVSVVESPASSSPSLDTVATMQPPPDEMVPTTSTSDAEQVPDIAPLPVEVVPEPPLGPREGAATAGHAGGLLVWGGTTPYDGGADESPPEPFSDGAWFDIPTSTWGPVPPAPLPAGLATAAAVGDTVYVLAGDRFAAYLPGTNSWTELPAPAGEARADAVLLAVGDQLVTTPSIQIFDPSTTSWRSVESSPPEGSAAFAGGEAGLFAITPQGNDASIARLDPASGTWEAMKTGQFEGVGALLGAVVGGDRLVATSWSGMQAAALDTTSGEWTTLPLIPTFDAKCQFRGISLGRSFVLDGCGRWLLDPDGRWHPLFADATDFAYRSPTPLNLVSLGPTAAVVDGRLLRADPATGEVLVDPGPGRLAGATIASGAVVESARREGATLQIELVDNCSLSARSTNSTMAPLDDGGQHSLAAALAAPPEGATSITFNNPWFGSIYELTCADAASYRKIAEQIDIAGESVGPVDITSLFAAERFNAAQPDQGLDRVIAILGPIGRSFDPPMVVEGLGGWQPPSNGRAFATVDLGTIAEVRGGPIDGLLVELSLVDDGDGMLRVDKATQWTRCTRGADLDDPQSCRGATSG